MALIGLIFGSDTGNTEAVANMIQNKLGKRMVEVKDIASSTKEEIAEFDLLILGIPTCIMVKINLIGMSFYLTLKRLTSMTNLSLFMA